MKQPAPTCAHGISVFKLCAACSGDEKGYGIFDVKDGVWMGNDKGPFNFSLKVATAGAKLMRARMKGQVRYEPRPLPKDQFRLRDEVTPPLNLAQGVREMLKEKDESR